MSISLVLLNAKSYQQKRPVTDKYVLMDAAYDRQDINAERGTYLERPDINAVLPDIMHIVNLG